MTKKTKPVAFYPIMPDAIINESNLSHLSDECITEFFNDMDEHVKQGRDQSSISLIMLVQQISKQRVIISQLTDALGKTVANVNLIAAKNNLI